MKATISACYKLTFSYAVTKTYLDIPLDFCLHAQNLFLHVHVYTTQAISNGILYFILWCLNKIFYSV